MHGHVPIDVFVCIVVCDVIDFFFGGRETFEGKNLCILM